MVSPIIGQIGKNCIIFRGKAKPQGPDSDFSLSNNILLHPKVTIPPKFLLMAFTIFYSWQTKTEAKYNKYFIDECLKFAIKQIKKELKDESPDFYIDRDTKDIPGQPHIITSIENKIKYCDVFVGDMSFVSYTETKELNGERRFSDKLLGKNKFTKEGNYSSNVAEEMGTARGEHRGDERIVGVFNTAYGDPKQLNFDSLQRRFPVCYEYSKDTNEKDKKVAKESLVKALKEKIHEILLTQHERQKDLFRPFITFKYWGDIIARPFTFETTDYIKTLFSALDQNLANPKKIFRLSGLSGIGKTRMLYEYFNGAVDVHNEARARHLLYADVNEVGETEILKTVKNLLLAKEKKILLVDNCASDFHNKLCSIITNVSSRLNLVSVYTDPEETLARLDVERNTELFRLENEKCKQTVQQILSKNFATDFQEDEIKLLIDFSSGISFVATLMAQNPGRGKYQPGSLTKNDVVQRLLGEFYTDVISKSVIEAACLFSKFGFFEELEYQYKAISECDDICLLDQAGDKAADQAELRETRFHDVCMKLHERQLLEKRGRTFAFRPTPLAVRMAENWWQSCSVSKFNRILPIIEKADLVESFCEQFRYLKNIDHAQAIVENLCGGVFRSAEVLDSSVGSRLFRSFVYVNSTACAEALYSTFVDLNQPALANVSKGRRNLVWALEKLCFPANTFEKAVKVMAAFAVWENEAIANNATNQFLQLFHIYLPGTMVSLEERMKIIRYCLGKGGDYEKLGVSALGSALKSGHFHRMGGVEDLGDAKTLEDYRPNNKEIYSYWKSTIEFLNDYTIGNSTFKEHATNILLDHFYGLCVQGAGELIIPVLEAMYNRGEIEKQEYRSQIQFALRSNRVFIQKTIVRLQEIYDELSPSSFEEKFRLYVKSPSSDEYFSQEEEPKGSSLEAKIKILAKEFVDGGLEKFQPINLFLDGPVNEGYQFGKAVGAIIDHQLTEAFTKHLLTIFFSIEEKERNSAFLMGFLEVLQYEKLKIEIFQNVLSEPLNASFAFQIARIGQLPYEELEKLVTMAEQGKFATSTFLNFDYGWGLRHLKPDQVIALFERIGKIDDVGKTVRYLILSKWTYNDKVTWDQYKEYIRSLTMTDSRTILTNVTNSMDQFNWTHTSIKLLEEVQADNSLAVLLTDIIVNKVSENSNYGSRGDYFRILDAIQNQYFELVWETVALAFEQSGYNFAYYHLKEVFGSHIDFNNSSAGLLLRDEKNTVYILKWAEDHPHNRFWIADMLPIYDGNPGVAANWHPLTKNFIDHFGSDSKLLSELGAKMGSYSWTGSVVPKLKSDLALFSSLLDHPTDEVKKWAQNHVSELERRIKWEQNRDEEDVWK